MQELIKSPLNYTGNKFKLLPQLIPLFPDKISMFVDLFGGGASVSLNVKANHIIYNDIVPYIANMFSELQEETIESALTKIYKIIDDFNLSITNKEGFEKLRDYYNNGNQSWDIFYTLMQYSFNYNYRFNNNHKYNMPFGKDRSHFTNNTKEKFTKFMNRLKELDIVFMVKDFREFDFSDFDENDFVYVDCPYLISTANYNDGKRGFTGWTEKEEYDLLKLLDELDSRNIRFGLSNVLELDGKTNHILIEWSKKYKVYDLNMSYSNSNYQKKSENTNTREVYICNY